MELQFTVTGLFTHMLYKNKNKVHVEGSVQNYCNFLCTYNSFAFSPQ